MSKKIFQLIEKYFFITNGYCFDRIKYGKKTNERSEKMANEIGIINEVGDFSEFIPLNEKDKKTYEDTVKRNNESSNNNSDIKK